MIETLFWQNKSCSLFVKPIRVRLPKIERRLYFMRVSWPLLQFAVCTKTFCSGRERRSGDELLSTGEGWLKDGPEIDEVVCKLFSRASSRADGDGILKCSKNTQFSSQQTSNEAKRKEKLQCY